MFHPKTLYQIYGITVRRMASYNAMSGSQANHRYEESIKTLNSLQSNPDVRSRADAHPTGRREKLDSFLKRAGITHEDVNRLSIVHITGTKGKGSICAICESILRHNNLKTGLFTSPHLVEVRERIRLNGRPLAKDLFVKHFWTVYEKLKTSQLQQSDEMPGYFAFLTIMAMHVFIEEKVDVSVLEVGIGGQYDSTNVIRKPRVCGIGVIGYDHESILGTTLSQIAWQKAGILKPGRPAVTVPQVDEAMETIKQRANEIGVKSLAVAPPLHTYKPENIELGLSGTHQTINASLAAQICKLWFEERENSAPNDQSKANKVELQLGNTFELTEPFIQGLKNVCWYGRSQIVRRDNVTYFLDGAHNTDSIKAAVAWYNTEAEREMKALIQTGREVSRVLLFNVTGGRDPTPLLEILSKSSHFDKALFCPNIVSHIQDNRADQTYHNVTPQMMRQKMSLNAQSWKELQNNDTPYKEENCINCAITRLEEYSRSKNSLNQEKHVFVLVTGSMHLVGDVLGLLGFTAEHL